MTTILTYIFALLLMFSALVGFVVIHMRLGLHRAMKMRRRRMTGKGRVRVPRKDLHDIIFNRMDV